MIDPEQGDADDLSTIVMMTRRLAAINDRQFSRDATRNLATRLLAACIKFRHPGVALAVYQHLRQEGFALEQLRSAATQDFSRFFHRHLRRLGEPTLQSAVDRVQRHLFGNVTA